MTVAELSVRLGVQGQSTLLSTLDKTKQGLQSVAQVASTTAQTINMSLGGSLAAIGGIAGFGMLGKAAFDSAVSFEALNARLSAITGSGQRAAQVLDMVRKVAEPSPFTFNQLATAATQLEAFGLKTEAILPRLANLGAAFGADEEHLRSLVNLFGRLSAGNFPDIEQLSMFGLSKSMFAAEGIKFDAGGSLLSSASETFDALIRIIDRNYSTMMQKMSGTTQTSLASLTDRWESALRIIGNSIVDILEPYINYSTKFIEKLVNSGALQDVVTRFFGPMLDISKAFSEGDVQSSVDKLLSSIVGFVGSVPKMMQDVFSNLGIMFNNLLSQSRQMLVEAGLIKDPKYDEYLQKRKSLGREYRYATTGFNTNEDIKYARRAYEYQVEELNKQYGYSPSADIMQGIKPWEQIGKETSAFIDTIVGKVTQAKTEASGAVVQPFGPYGNIADAVSGKQSESNDLLYRIANNTKASADALTLRRQTLGGGQIGALGLTAAEVGAAGRTVGTFGNGLIPAGTDLERAVRRTIRDEGRRNGVPGYMRRF